MENSKDIENRYIACYLKDGSCLDFNKRCNEVSVWENSENFILFKEYLNDEDFIILAAVPKNNILYINFLDLKKEV